MRTCDVCGLTGPSGKVPFTINARHMCHGCYDRYNQACAARETALGRGRNFGFCHPMLKTLEEATKWRLHD